MGTPRRPGRTSCNQKPAASLTDEQRNGYLGEPQRRDALGADALDVDVGRPGLRRRLSDLLVGLTAAHGNFSAEASRFAEHRHRDAVPPAAAGEFVAEVLGPRLLVTTDNPFRDGLLPLVETTASLTAQADAAVEALAVDVTGRVIERNEELTTILPQERWRAAARSRAPLAWRRLRTGGFTGNTRVLRLGGAGCPAFDRRLPTDDLSTLRVLHPLRLRNGPARGTLALVKVRAEADGDGWTITGDKWYVPGVDAADVILVIARTVGGLAPHAVDPLGRRGHRRGPCQPDPTGRWPASPFAGAPARRG